MINFFVAFAFGGIGTLLFVLLINRLKKKDRGHLVSSRFLKNAREYILILVQQYLMHKT